MADRNLVLQLLITAKDNASAALGKIGTGVQSVGSAVSSALAPLRSFGTLLAAAVGVGSAQQVVGLADAYTRLTNQLRVATKSEEEYQAALKAVTEVAKRSNADLASTAGLYGKIAQSAQSLGIDQQQVANITELVGKAMQLSGAEANTAAAGIQQFGQALSTGRLSGDEFNSVFEASPKLIEAIANGMGVAVEEMRAMAEAQQLTSDVVVRALLSQKTAIDEVYGKLPQTLGQAMTGLSNAATLFAGKLNEQTGATQGLSTGLKFLAENMDAVVAVMGGAFAAAALKYAASLKESAAAALAARAAARDQAIAAKAQQEAALASAQGQLAAAQAASNRALAEQRLRLQVVAAMEAELGYGVVTANLTAARQQAAAAAQAATTAAQRYATAQSALVAAQGAGTASVGLFARAMGFLTGPAGLILTAVSAFGLLLTAFKTQKPAVDALKLSTDEYTEALKKYTAAQLATQGVELNRQIETQKKVVDDLVGSVERQVKWLGNVRAANGNVASATEELNLRQAELDTQTQALNELTARRNQLLEEQENRQKKLSDAEAAQVDLYAKQATAMDKLNIAIDQRAKHLQAVSDAQIAETEALLAKAEAEGKANEVEKLTIQLAEQRAAAAKIAAELAQGEAVAAETKAAALSKIAAAHDNNNPKEIEAARLAQEAATLKRAEAAESQALAVQLEAEAQSLSNGAAATQVLADKLTALREETASNIDITDRLAEANRFAFDEALKLAQAKGDEAEAARIVADATREEVAAAQERIAQLREQEAQIERHINQLYAAANADGVYTDAEREAVEALKQKAEAIGLDIFKLEEHLPLQEREAQQAAAMAGPIGQLSRLYAELTTEHERAARTADRYYDTQIKEVDAAIQVAKARGNEAEAADLLQKKQQLLIDQAEAMAAAAQQAAVDAQNKVDAYTLEAAATEGVSAAEREQIAALQEVADAKQTAAAQAQNHAEALKKETDAAEEGSGAFDDASRNAYKFSDAAGDVARRNAEVGKSAGEAAEKTEAMTASLIKFRGETAIAADYRGIGQFNELFNQVKNSIDQATKAAQRLGEQGISAASSNTEELARDLLGVEGALSDAAHTAGTNLVNALQDAREEARGMAEELADLAEDFQREILQIRGDRRALLDLEYREDLERLEALRAKAGAIGEDEYQDAVGRLNALQELKLQKLAEEEAARRESDRTLAETANDARGAWGGLADEAERAYRATRAMGNADLSQLHAQLNSLNGSVRDLAGVL